jgi:L-asparaginase
MGSPQILILYTGGTIGSAPRDKSDPGSPQVVVSWEDLVKGIPRLGDPGLGIEAVSLNPPLDSCNVGPQQWKWMAKEIEKNYEHVNGFVILHGTDTLVYTASALSAMLRNLGKPVVLTGAQRSALVDARNDALQNVITSLYLANARRYGLPVVPEVILCFGGRILRGNRSFKRDTADYAAYESPNYPPLGEAGNNIVIDERLILPPPPEGRVFRAVTRMDTRVTTIAIYPGVQDTDIVKRQLELPGLRAAIVTVYGSGDIPTDEPFLRVFRDAHDKGMILAAVTQCPRGPIELGIYETSAKLIEVGFISGYDITLAAAQTKLMTLLGEDEDDDREAIEDKFMRSLAGEQSRSTYLTRFRGKKGVPTSIERLCIGPDGTIPSRRLRAGALELEGSIKRIERALLRLRGACLTQKGANPKARIKVYMNLEQDEAPADDDKRLASVYDKWPSQDGLVIFDVTRVVREMGEPGRPVSFTIILETAEFELEWGRADLAVVVNELRG